MCTADKTCDRWDQRYATLFGELKAWAWGAHGHRCSGAGCVMAVVIVTEILACIGASLEDLHDGSPESPRNDQMYAGDDEDF